jgi:hypothetical protein
MHKKKPLSRERLFFWNKNENGNLEFGVWNLEFGIWSLEFRIMNSEL